MEETSQPHFEAECYCRQNDSIPLKITTIASRFWRFSVAALIFYLPVLPCNLVRNKGSRPLRYQPRPRLMPVFLEPKQIDRPRKEDEKKTLYFKRKICTPRPHCAQFSTSVGEVPESEESSTRATTSTIDWLSKERLCRTVRHGTPLLSTRP